MSRLLILRFLLLIFASSLSAPAVINLEEDFVFESSLDDTSSQVPLPHVWQPNKSETGLYTARFIVPNQLRGQPLGISLGVIGGEEEVFFNGQRIGGSGTLGPYRVVPPDNLPRLYEIPEELVIFGQPNRIEIKVQQIFGGSAGLIYGPWEFGNYHELRSTREAIRRPIKTFELMLLSGLIFGSLLIIFLMVQAGRDQTYFLFLLLTALILGGLISESHWFHDLGWRIPVTVRIGWTMFNLVLPATLLFLNRFLEQKSGHLFRAVVFSSSLIALILLFAPDADFLTIPYLLCQILALAVLSKFVGRAIRSKVPEALPLALGLFVYAFATILAMLIVLGFVHPILPGVPQLTSLIFQVGLLALYTTFLFAIAIRFVKSRRYIRELVGRSLVVQDEDRRRVARELHDGIGQNLQALKIRSHLIQKQDAPGEIGGQLSEDLGKTIEELRRISYKLHPVILNLLPCGQAIESSLNEQKNDLPFEIKCTIGFKGRLSDEAERHLFRIFQESLNNATKHSEAENFTVSLLEKRRKIELTIQDDGIGFCLESARMGLGLQTIRERCESLGGHCEIKSSPNFGTKIRITIPTDS